MHDECSTKPNRIIRLSGKQSSFDTDSELFRIGQSGPVWKAAEAGKAVDRLTFHV